MTNLPDPLVPASVDLRGFQYMALDVVRVRDSELMDQEPAVIVAAILSWCVSWHQVPAGSLPDDDRTLARLLAPHEGIKGWKALRANGALRGWVKCSDGRLYHPVVCAKALEAYDQKQAAQRKRDLDVARLRRWRNERGLTEKEWASLRAHVFTRDKWKCTACGSVDDLHCDHIVPLTEGGAGDPSNLTTLCRACHGRKTALTGNADDTHIIAASLDAASNVPALRDQIGSDQIRSDPSLTSPPPSPVVSQASAGTGDNNAGQGLSSNPERKPNEVRKALGKKTNALDPRSLKLAIETGNVHEVLAVFHVDRGHDDEWDRETDGLQIGEVVAVLAWRRYRKDPVRLPSGFRAALAAWLDIGLAVRRETAVGLLGGLGIELDAPTEGMAT